MCINYRVYGREGMKTIAVLTFFLIAVYILWNCDIARSTSILIIFLGLMLYVMVYPGREEFEEDTTILGIDEEQLKLAGIVKPSLFDCATDIGSTPLNPFFANVG